MSELTSTTIKSSPGSLSSNRALAAARTVLGWLRREWRIRSTVHTLEPLNDHLLKDIGLMRHDIEVGVRKRCSRR